MTASTERLHTRVTPEVKAMLESAAQLCCLSVSDFVREASIERAEKVFVERMQVTRVSPQSYDSMFEALCDEPAPALARAAQRRQTRLA